MSTYAPHRRRPCGFGHLHHPRRQHSKAPRLFLFPWFPPRQRETSELITYSHTRMIWSSTLPSSPTFKRKRMISICAGSHPESTKQNCTIRRIHLHISAYICGCETSRNASSKHAEGPHTDAGEFFVHHTNKQADTPTHFHSHATLTHTHNPYVPLENPCYPTCTHTHSLPHTNTRAHTRSNAYPHALEILTYARIFPYITHSPIHTLSLSLSLSLTHTLLTHTQTNTHTHTHTHKHTHTNTHNTHTHTLGLICQSVESTWKFVSGAPPPLSPPKAHISRMHHDRRMVHVKRR